MDYHHEWCTICLLWTEIYFPSSWHLQILLTSCHKDFLLFFFSPHCFIASWCSCIQTIIFFLSLISWFFGMTSAHSFWSMVRVSQTMNERKRWGKKKKRNFHTQLCSRTRIQWINVSLKEETQHQDVFNIYVRKIFILIVEYQQTKKRRSFILCIREAFFHRTSLSMKHKRLWRR